MKFILFCVALDLSDNLAETCIMKNSNEVTEFSKENNSQYLSFKWNLIRLGGPAHEIVTNTSHKTLLGVVGVKGVGRWVGVQGWWGARGWWGFRGWWFWCHNGFLFELRRCVNTCIFRILIFFFKKIFTDGLLLIQKI